MGPSSVKGHSQPDSADGCPATDLVAAAEGLREVAAELDPAIAERADELVRRMRGGSFRLAFCGGFSNGKSTLMNALLGSPVLPVGVLPVTAVPTEVVAGREVAAEIELEDGRSVACPVGELARWVSEADNPGNTKGVARVVVSTPSPLLSGGLTLVDTPGLESIFGHNDMEALTTSGPPSWPRRWGSWPPRSLLRWVGHIRSSPCRPEMASMPPLPAIALG